MLDGRNWAIRELSISSPSSLGFSSVLRLHVAMKYQIQQWVAPAFTVLVTSDWKMDQLACIPPNEIMVEMFDIILKTRDIIEMERKRLATVPPLCVRSPDCSHHKGCTIAWGTRWVLKIGVRLLDPDTLHRMEYYEAPGKIAELRVPDMNPGCLSMTVAEVESGQAFNFEHLIITEAVNRLLNNFLGQ
jgi:hypothetical protein